MSRTRPLLMTRCLLLVGLAFLPFSGVAEDVVVLSRGEFRVLGAAAPAPVASPDREAFLASTARDLRTDGALSRRIPLVNPPSWGRIVRPDSRGDLEIAEYYPHGFRFNLSLEGLLAGHRYVLCINDRPNHPGNELLPESVPGHPEEKYLDFYTATTDGAGNYAGRFALFLKPGQYNVHFYVKDTTDHKIVLYGVEYFDFTAG